MEDIKADIRAFIVENILFSSNGFTYSDDTSFLENGILDSMSIMDLVLFVEGKYKIEINDQEITPDNFDTIDDLDRFVRSKIAASTG